MKPATSIGYRRLCFSALAFALLALLTGGVIALMGKTSNCGPRTADRSNLRQLGQSSLIYAYEQKDQFPEASDVWDYARQIAESAGLDDARMWQSRLDPAADTSPDPIRSVLDSDPAKPRRLHSAFRKIKPSFSVVLGKLDINMPATTPLLWTRGLQSDGTWAPHSPYGTSGGYIMFLGGNVTFYQNLTQDGGQLVSRDGSRTANILEALPPGSRIGEYEPTPQEKTEWTRINRERAAAKKRTLYIPWVSIALLWSPFVALSVDRSVKKNPGAFTVLLWPIPILILASLLIPGLWHIGSPH
jgi:hypothetical protein